MIQFTREEIHAARNEQLKDCDAKPELFAPGTLGWHEALHTAWVCLDQVDRQLLDHPAVLLHAEAYELAQAAHTALFNLYQLLGAENQ